MAEWQPIETVPLTSPDAPILRWHRFARSVVTVFRNRKEDGSFRMPGALDWITKDLSISWTEDSFTPHWMPLQEPPKGEEK